MSAMGIIVFPYQSVAKGLSDALDVVILFNVSTKHFLSPDELIRLGSMVEVGESEG